MKDLFLFNTLSGKKELFTPIVPGTVGMYVCGPTVYSDVHLGNCRTFASFDLLFRYLKYLGYKVRYVRNITDVGHLEGDLDIGGEDKIAKKALLEQIEPMEIVQRYANGFHAIMQQLNLSNPSIEPTATGHLLEQLDMIQRILDNGLAYVQNGSVYFDTLKYAESTGKYGMISGRKIDELIAESRDNLKYQDEKKHPSDFAIWIKADPEHLMKWQSKWSVGFPGWHLECSAMSTKYLGEKFDIHGGGQDLKFPHHENEVAQNIGACGLDGANYWMHTNMLLLNGKKMSKSDGNSILPQELFSGQNSLFKEAYSPMELKFYMLQSHYRSTLDLTEEGLSGSAKGFKKLKEAFQHSKNLSYVDGIEMNETNLRIAELLKQIEEDLSDDLNSPKAIASLFELVSWINSWHHHPAPSTLFLNARTKELLDQIFEGIVSGVLGIQLDATDNSESQTLAKLMNLVLELRAEARLQKDWATSDKIRDSLDELNIQVKDSKEGVSWVYK